MTALKTRLGDPDIDQLREEGYVEQNKISRRRYYSFTRKGWGAGAKEINVNTLEDIFELPCFENMVEDFESKMVGRSGRTSTTSSRWLCGYKITTKCLMKI